jgi:hypothetical protein
MAVQKRMTAHMGPTSPSHVYLQPFSNPGDAGSAAATSKSFHMLSLAVAIGHHHCNILQAVCRLHPEYSNPRGQGKGLTGGCSGVCACGRTPPAGWTAAARTEWHQTPAPLHSKSPMFMFMVR